MKRSSYLWPYITLYVSVYPDSHTALYLRLNLNPYLDLDLNLYLHLYLYLVLDLGLFLFQKPFGKPNPLSFRWL